MPEKIAITQIIANPEQPRTVFDPVELQALATSLATDGLLNPIAVEGPHDGLYILLDGERRWRAAQMAGWTEIDAQIRPALNGDGPEKRLVLALIGNLQRSDMGPIDEARAYMRLRQMGYSVEEIATRAGRHPSNIHSRLRMLEFPEEVQDLFNSKRLPISERINGAFRRLSFDEAKTVARRSAAGEMTEQKIVNLCNWVLRHKERAVKSPKLSDLPKDSTCPAIDLNKSALANQVAFIRKPIEAACRACGMYDDPTYGICKACPLTDFVRRLKS